MATTYLQNGTKVSAPSVTGFTGLALQRKCACGGSAGVMNECNDCCNNKFSLQRSTQNSERESRNSDGVPPIVHEVLRSPGQPLDAATPALMGIRLGHDFGSVGVHAVAATEAFAHNFHPRAVTPGRNFNFRVGRDRPKTMLGEENLDWQTESFDRGDAAEPTGADALPTDGNAVPTQSAATLPGVQTGGTGCDTRTGTVKIEVTNNDPCTKDCSTNHEAKHSADIGPCCTKAGEASAKTDKEDEKDTIQNKFDNWAKVDNVNFLECRAYGVSVACGEAKLKKLKCPDSHDKCCGKVTRYVSSSTTQKTGTCNNAGEKLTDCPFT